MISQGLIQIYTGDSKGKTTAALGQIIRAIGHGNRACLIQYMKGSSYYGEIATLTKLDQVDHFQYGRVCAHNTLIKQGESDCLGCGDCFVLPGEATDFDRHYSTLALKRSQWALSEGNYDVVVLDEVLNAVYFELITEEDLLKLIDLKQNQVELILTGRKASDGILKKADLVTDMKKIKHPFDAGVSARRGIEY